jgi:hypothetical protein
LKLWHLLLWMHYFGDFYICLFCLKLWHLLRWMHDLWNFHICLFAWSFHICFVERTIFETFTFTFFAILKIGEWIFKFRFLWSLFTNYFFRFAFFLIL